LCCRAKSLISTKTVVPNPATRWDINEISESSPLKLLHRNNHDRACVSTVHFMVFREGCHDSRLPPQASCIPGHFRQVSISKTVTDHP
jgi:hypothetical protein